ncbi:protein VTE6, chloroplastic [Selaginella moellendorffii]|uniref:protein VTE6, chloroplastic n=1 Tax=Selaginella moellendorffii TaxID=88036 RepID=UPI000D1C392E|nr:protein VTE6, chloroplastic [Selaginella moellendorffii]|eukprot:XP_024520833.1 protein VTE6, chloroplastic [Selaginella moellendorffii]
MVANGVIFALGFPLLRAGLTWPGVGNAYILGLGTGATKVKIKQKEAEGIAEKRSGKRGPASVWGSGSAGIVCALAAASGIGGSDFLPLWKLAFVASFSTKLSDTISSEIGKAYGKTTYLVTNFSIVPRGTEGAVSLEGTAAGLVASILLASAAWSLHEVWINRFQIA